MATIKATIKNVVTILNVMEFVYAYTNTITLKKGFKICNSQECLSHSLITNMKAPT
jgi:hypothetical protein